MHALGLGAKRSSKPFRGRHGFGLALLAVVEPFGVQLIEDDLLSPLVPSAPPAVLASSAPQAAL